MTTTPLSGRLRSTVAEEVRVLLARRRMSGVKLAEAIGRSQAYVSRRLTGETAFDLDDLEQIAATLGVGVADLLPRDLRGGISVTNHPRAGRPRDNRPNGGPRERPERGDLRRPRRTRPPQTMVPTRRAA